ncbi:MAG: hypothetical protein CMA00_001875 [Methanobacteriota archaeon]|mgnify:CR=1 FL=1|nr:MAG: hypothetical protein CMA00_001875 [Euryarchaeota archaeon]|tara:strand:- start:2663 stop:3256 length:594 start_codon:yes stop_codon:yes gene_type:complete
MAEPGELPIYPDPHRPDFAANLLVEDGLELNEPNEEDAEELFSLVEENREYLREWLPWLDDVSSVEDEKSLIRMEAQKKGSSKIYLIRISGRIVGVLGLNWVDWDNRSFGLGYWLSEDSTGQGIITKSCSRLIDHCFTNLRLHRSVIEAAVENYSSISVAERLGMRLEGTSRDREWLYDRYVDSVMYAITSSEWKKD